MERDGIEKISPELVGPPRGTLTNPTIWLFVAVLGAFFLSMAAYLLDSAPLSVAMTINVVCLYAAYTISHEAVHRIAHADHRVNAWMGRIAAALEGFSFPLFRALHLQHHAHTNDPERDPDWIIGRKPRWLLPLWLIVRLTHDNFFMLRRRLWSGRGRQLAEHLTTVVLQLSVVVGAVLTGHGREVLFLWLIPVLMAGTALFLTVAWAVHYPHESNHPLENTRYFRGRLLQVLTLNQSYHLVHHLWARIPWFRYGKAIDVAERALLERGASAR